MISERFVIAVFNASTAQTNALAAALAQTTKAASAGWWHRISGLWVIVARPGALSCAQLSDVAQLHIRDGQYFVCRFDDWSGQVPVVPPESKKWFMDHLDGEEAE